MTTLSDIRLEAINEAGAGGLTVYATLDDLPTSGLTSGDQAFITATNRIYVSNGSGWYNIALFNATPTLSISPSGAVTLAVDGSTPTVITLTGADSDNADVSLTYTVESDGSFANIATLSQDSSVFTITPLAEGSATPGSSTLTFKVSDGISFGSGTTEFSLTFGPDWASATESIITASDAQVLDYFGWDVAINSDATYVIVGAQREDGGAGNPISDAGAAYIFTRAGSTWSQQAILRASDAQASDYFGDSVSINSDGTYAIVGAHLEDTGGSNAGAAYIFTRAGSTWSQQAKIQASDAEANDVFGESVSINSDGTYAIIGAQYEDTNGNNAGAAYIFTRAGSTWSQQAKIQSSDISADDYFGWDVAMNSDTTYAIVGAPYENTGGAAYVFTRSVSTWTQQQKIQSSDIQASDEFGKSVSMSSDATYAIVGATAEDGGAGNPLANAGAAYIFTRAGSTWSQQAKLVPDDLQFIDNFGQVVAISGDGNTAIVGTQNEDGGPGDPLNNAGAAYIFTRSGSTWTQQAKITASDAQANDRLGVSVSLNSDGTYAIVGAHLEDGGAGNPTQDAGAAYIYKA
jgi:phage gpG-like protein